MSFVCGWVGGGGVCVCGYLHIGVEGKIISESPEHI